MKSTEGMTIDRVWELCIAMWDWVIERIVAGDKRPVDELKSVWCEEHGYELLSECFFCDADGSGSEGNCSKCPAMVVDPTFCCWGVTPYNYAIHPLKFTAKLHAINKKRLAMKETK